jgi:hypothetical protein
MEIEPLLCATLYVAAERLKVPGEFVAAPTVTVVAEPAVMVNAAVLVTEPPLPAHVSVKL